MISQKLLRLERIRSAKFLRYEIPSFSLTEAIKILIVFPPRCKVLQGRLWQTREARLIHISHVNKSAGICGSSENHECQDCSTSRVPLRRVTSSNSNVIFALVQQVHSRKMRPIRCISGFGHRLRTLIFFLIFFHVYHSHGFIESSIIILLK